MPVDTNWDGFQSATIPANRYQQMFINGYLDVSGRTIIRNGDLSLNSGRLLVSGDASLNSKLFVAGDASLNAKVTVAGDASLNAKVTIAGDASLNTKVTVAGDASLNAKVTIGSDASFKGFVQMDKDVSLNNKLYVNYDTSLNGNVQIQGNLLVNGNLTAVKIANKYIINTTTNNYQLIVSEDISLNGRLFVGGNVGIGIGTTNPAYKLDIVSEANKAPLNVKIGTTDVLTVSSTGVVGFAGGANFNGGTVNFEGATVTNIPQSAITSLTTDLGNKAPKANPLFTGYVGIGTTNPLGNLDVHGTGNFVGTMVLKGGTAKNTAVGVSTTVHAGSISIINTEGVGIGTTAGNYLPILSLKSNVGNASYLNIYNYRHTNGTDWQSVSTRIQHTIDLDNMAYIEFNPPGNVSGIGIYTRNSSAGTLDAAGSNGITIKNNGNVGIGTADPTFPLHVESTTISTSSGGTYYGTAGTFPLSSSTRTVSIYTSGWILTKAAFGAATTITFSDRRMKNNIQDIEDQDALNILRKIQPKLFNYNDTIRYGAPPVYGFIAQEIENILPYAVNKMKMSIPSIYELADISGCIVSLKTKSTAIFNADINGLDASGNAIKIQFYDETNVELNRILVKIIDETTFSVDKPFLGDKIFVYGHEINDFMGLQKDAIFTITSAALQQIDREYNITKQEVIELKTENNDLKTQLTNILSRLSALENK